MNNEEKTQVGTQLFNIKSSEKYEVMKNKMSIYLVLLIAAKPFF